MKAFPPFSSAPGYEMKSHKHTQNTCSPIFRRMSLAATEQASRNLPSDTENYFLQT